jgi:hypothetical protein
MKKSGQTLVEFALAFPILAIVLLAIIQYGFIFSALQTLRHGAQITSRTLSLPGGGGTNAQAIACTSISPLLDCAKLQPVVIANTTVGGNPAVQVTLQYDLPLIIKFVVPNATGNNLRLTAVAVDRKN